MPLTTGPIENQGNLPANATNVRVKILNRTGGALTGVVRVFRLNGTRQLLSSANFNVGANASGFVTLSLVGGASQYETEIVPNQPVEYILPTEEQLQLISLPLNEFYTQN